MVGFAAKCAIGIGILVAFIAASTVSRGGFGVMAISAAPGIILAMLGNFILVNIQTARATVDSAEYAQQSLKLSRDQLELSKQMLALAKPTNSPSGYAAETAASALQNVSFDTEAPNTNAAATTSTPALKTHAHNNGIIEERGGEFFIEDRPYVTLEAAQLAIDRAARREKAARLEAS